MREIKFEFIIDRKVSIDKLVLSIEELMDGDFPYWDNSDVIAKRQYTGLKDKNGVEIYEGDIVKHYDKFIGEVRWLQPDCAFVMAGSSHRYTLLIDERLRNEYQVIGNIYENPELLESK